MGEARGDGQDTERLERAVAQLTGVIEDELVRVFSPMTYVDSLMERGRCYWLLRKLDESLVDLDQALLEARILGSRPFIQRVSQMRCVVLGATGASTEECMTAARDWYDVAAELGSHVFKACALDHIARIQCKAEENVESMVNFLEAADLFERAGKMDRVEDCRYMAWVMERRLQLAKGES